MYHKKNCMTCDLLLSNGHKKEAFALKMKENHGHWPPVISFDFGEPRDGRGYVVILPICGPQRRHRFCGHLDSVPRPGIVVWAGRHVPSHADHQL